MLDRAVLRSCPCMGIWPDPGGLALLERSRSRRQDVRMDSRLDGGMGLGSGAEEEGGSGGSRDWRETGWVVSKRH